MDRSLRQQTARGQGAFYGAIRGQGRCSVKSGLGWRGVVLAFAPSKARQDFGPAIGGGETAEQKAKAHGCLQFFPGGAPVYWRRGADFRPGR
jgi:hypothetical protein